MCIARNYADAVRSLRAAPFDLVLLDHDLDDSRHNGQDVAAFMATRLGSRRRPEVLVHSTNPAGAFGIYLTLKRSGYEALASIVESIVLTPGPDGYTAKLTLKTEQAAPGGGLFVQSGCGGAIWSKADLLTFAPSLPSPRERRGRPVAEG